MGREEIRTPQIRPCLPASPPHPVLAGGSGGFEVESLALSPGWRTTDGATQTKLRPRGTGEGSGSECECWRFMRAAGGPSAQLGGSDSWAACGWRREQEEGVGDVGPALGAAALEGRGQGRDREATPPSPQLWAEVRSGVPACSERLRKLWVSGHSEREGCPFPTPSPSSPTPSCPLPSPKPKAFGPLQQLCQAFGWVRAWAGEGSSCHPSPCRQGVG